MDPSFVGSITMKEFKNIAPMLKKNVIYIFVIQGNSN